MLYYEIIRFTDSWPEMEEYETVDKLVKRNWKKKAVDHMSQWDYGGENIDSARSIGSLRQSITDPQSPSDKILYEKDGRYLCCSHCPSGLYDAYYLVGEVSEADL